MQAIHHPDIGDMTPPYRLDELNFESLNEAGDKRSYVRLFLAFTDCTSAREQIGRTYKQFRNTPYALSYSELAALFSLSKPRIGQIMDKWNKYGEQPGQSGRPRLLNPDQWDRVVSFIDNRYKGHRPATIAAIRDFILREFDAPLSSDSIRSIITYSREVRAVHGERMESGRVDCPTDAIDAWFEKMREVFVEQIPAEFVVNVDEVGAGGTELDRDVQCVVPARHLGDTVPLPNELKVDHATMMAAIAADGTALKPLIVVQRKTLDAELRAAGYTDDRILFAHSPTGYINTAIFLKWISEIYIPYLRGRRTMKQYDGTAVLILDGCSCHDRARVNTLLAGENVSVQYIPAHSSDQLQFLDLGIFAVMKSHMAYALTDAAFSAVTRHVMRMFNAWQMATTPVNVVNAFRRGGFVTSWNKKVGMSFVEIDERYASKVRHFQQNPELSIQKDRRRTRL